MFAIVRMVTSVNEEWRRVPIYSGRNRLKPGAPAATCIWNLLSESEFHRWIVRCAFWDL